MSRQSFEPVVDYNFVPVAKTKAIKKPTSNDEWLDFEEPLVVPANGKRGGGKGGIMDYMAQRYYDEHFTVLHIWSARSFENLYWCINKNCDLHFRKIKQLLKNKFYKDEFRPYRLPPNEEEKYINLAERGSFIKTKNGKITKLTKEGYQLVTNQMIHCRCRKAIPILWVVPEYINFDTETIDRFNGVFWKDFEEYKNNMSEITRKEKELLIKGKLKKPIWLRPKPLIKIVKVTVPTGSGKSGVERKDKFYNEWVNAMVQARDEHRVLVVTPMMFEGQDKFDFIAEVFRIHMNVMYKSGHFKPLTEKDVGKPYKYWNKKQRNWHKVAIFMNEARSVTPSNKLSGEKGAGKSKRTVYDIVPEMRHMKTWYHTDYQSPNDIFDGIRNNSDFVIVKRTSLNLIGADWKWFFQRIENDRFGFAQKLVKGLDDIEQLKNFEMREPKLKEFLDVRRPRIGELPSDKAYIVYPDNSFILIKNPMGQFHHKLSTEDFLLDSGIIWSIDREIKQEEEPKTKTEQKQQSKLKKEESKMLFNKMTYLKEVEKKDWKAIKEDLLQCQNEGMFTCFNIKGMSNVTLSNKYGKLKRKYEKIPN